MRLLINLLIFTAHLDLGMLVPLLQTLRRDQNCCHAVTPVQTQRARTRQTETGTMHQ